jgi:GNAT superfamily N-acetyltransferase
MHDRCSPDTRFRRWHGHVRTFPRSYLDALLTDSDEHLAVVAHHEAELIGFASAATVAPDVREIGILVEDGWQRRGVGRQLLTGLVAECVDRGARYLRSELLASDAGLLEPLRTLGPTTSRVSHGVVTAHVRLWA